MKPPRIAALRTNPPMAFLSPFWSSDEFLTAWKMSRAALRRQKPPAKIPTIRFTAFLMNEMFNDSVPPVAEIDVVAKAGAITATATIARMRSFFFILKLLLCQPTLRWIWCGRNYTDPVYPFTDTCSGPPGCHNSSFYRRLPRKST